MHSGLKAGSDMQITISYFTITLLSKVCFLVHHRLQNARTEKNLNGKESCKDFGVATNFSKLPLVFSKPTCFQTVHVAPL